MEEMTSAVILLKSKKILLNGPYAAAGYSAGGFLGFKIAKHLTIRGDPVSFVGLIDTFATVLYPISVTEFFLT